MYRNIQLLRAIAALMVFLHHIRLHYAAMNGNNPLLLGVMEFGYAGVDVFFVISGFIMMHLITDGPAYERAPRTFLGRRFVRIYFWYWPCLLIALLVLWRTDKGRFPQVSLLDSFLLAGLRLDKLVLDVSWSLTHELFFYVITSLLLVLAPAARVPRVVGTLLAMQVLYTAFSTYREDSAFVLLNSPYNIEFLLGCMLFFAKDLLYRYGDELLCLSLAGLFLYLGAHYGITNTVQRVPTFGLGAVFVVCLALLLEQRRRFVAGDAMVAVGAASYTIYLTHLVFIAVFYHSGIRGWLASMGAVGRECGFIAFIVAVTAVCVAISKWLEMPLIRWSYRRLGLAKQDAPAVRKPRTASITMPT